jgi:hypothetical protein
MKITITAIGGTAFLLGDDSVGVVPTGPQLSVGCGGQIKEGFVNKQKRQIQTSPLFRAAYALVIPRFNLQNRFSFTVQRSFTSVEDCLSFIAGHPDSVPTQGEIQIQNVTSLGETLRYLPAAVVESVEITQHVGLSCNTQYTISGNGAWQTEP